jgi:hypothetical protein
MLSVIAYCKVSQNAGSHPSNSDSWYVKASIIQTREIGLPLNSEATNQAFETTHSPENQRLRKR